MKLTKLYVFFLSNVITKFYPEIIKDCIANVPQIAVYVADKFKLEIFSQALPNQIQDLLVLISDR